MDPRDGNFRSVIIFKFSPIETAKWNTYRTVRSMLKKIEGAGNYHWAIECTEIDSSEYEVISSANTVNDFRYFKVGFKIVVEEELETEEFHFDMYAHVPEILRDRAAGKYKFKVPKDQSIVTLQCVCRMYRFHDDFGADEEDSECESDTSVTLTDDQCILDELSMCDQSTNISLTSNTSSRELSLDETIQPEVHSEDEEPFKPQRPIEIPRYQPLEPEEKEMITEYLNYLIIYAVDEMEKGRTAVSKLHQPSDYVALATKIREVLMETRDAVKAHYFANLLVFAHQNNFDALLSDCCETFACHVSLLNYEAFWEIAEIMEPKSEELKARIVAFVMERSYTPFELRDNLKVLFPGIQ